MRLRLLTCFIFLILFSKKSHGFTEEDKLSEIVANQFDIDGIDKLEDLPRFVFNNEDCGNLEVVNDGGELTGDINQKK